jgi:hypothetical protein
MTLIWPVIVQNQLILLNEGRIEREGNAQEVINEQTLKKFIALTPYHTTPRTGHSPDYHVKNARGRSFGILSTPKSTPFLNF